MEKRNLSHKLHLVMLFAKEVAEYFGYDSIRKIDILYATICITGFNDVLVKPFNTKSLFKIVAMKCINEDGKWNPYPRGRDYLGWDDVDDDFKSIFDDLRKSDNIYVENFQKGIANNSSINAFIRSTNDDAETLEINENRNDSYRAAGKLIEEFEQEFIQNALMAIPNLKNIHLKNNRSNLEQLQLESEELQKLQKQVLDRLDTKGLVEKHQGNLRKSNNPKKVSLSSNVLSNGYVLNDYVAAKQKGFIGREDEIHRAMSVLIRKDKPNLCLIGEAGVGKTAIVYEVAKRINSGNVPERLKNKYIFYVNVARMVSGTKYRGEFEEKVTSVLEEVLQKKDFILFLDEMHTAIDAGSTSEGSQSFGALLKPYIDRGIQVIGTTTNDEYRKHLEKDKALMRRMEVIKIDEPSIDESIEMIKAEKPAYENHYGITISDDVINAAVKYSSRFITNRFLPDKAFNVIDETTARIVNNGEKEIAKKDVLETIQKSTGINLEEISDEENSNLDDVEKELSKMVIGQEKAVKLVAKAIRRNRAGLNAPEKPIASFLFVGPTGVGKTELGKNIAKFLNGTEKSLIKIDMSEYMEEASVSKLIGSAPGYVGYGQGGQLTEKVKRNPYSVIIFDEIEKAHPKISDIMLQILDEGTLTDSNGTKVCFKNTVIVITSNIGSKSIGKVVKNGVGFQSNNEETIKQNTEEVVMKELKEHFRPEFLNRLDNVVIFNHLNKDVCVEIVHKLMKEIVNRVAEKKIKLMFDNRVIDAVIEEGYDAELGARNLKRAIQNIVIDNLADEIISGKVKPGDNIKMSMKGNNAVFKVLPLISA